MMPNQSLRMFKFALAAALSSALCAAQAETYYWIGSDSSDWTAAANWSLTAGGDAASSAPTSSDDAVFASSATIVMSDKINIAGLTLNENVRLAFAGQDEKYPVLQVKTFTAATSATLALSDMIIIPGSSAGIDLSCAIEIPEGAKSGIYAYGGNKDTRAMTVSGNLTGSGDVYFRNYTTGGSRAGVTLSGNNESFTGTAHVLSSGDPDMLGKVGYATSFRWKSADSGSSKATWIVSTVGSDQLKIPASVKLGEVIGGKLSQSEKSTTVEIGGKNTSFAFSVSDFNRASSGNSVNVTKVGTGDVTFSARMYGGSSNGGVLTIQEGGILLSTNATYNSILFAGGWIGPVAGEPFDPVGKFSSDSTTPVVIDDQGIDLEIGTEFTAARFPNGFEKRGSGTLTLTTAPTYSGTTKVTDGCLIVPRNTTIACLSLSEGAKLSVPYAGDESETTVLTIQALADGTTAEMVKTAMADGLATVSVTQDSDTGSYAVVATRGPKEFVWSGAGGDDCWENVKNWTVGSVVPNQPPAPNDTVVFPARTADDESWTVSLSDSAMVTSVVFNAAASLRGADIYTQEVTSRLETATAPVVTLGDDAGFHAYDVASAKLTVSVPLCITASAERPAEIAGWWSGNVPASGAAMIRINGNLTGDGALTVRGARAGIEFNGDNSAFAGAITIPSDYSVTTALRVSPRFVKPESTSSNAVWVINNFGNLLQQGSQTYAFGALSGYVSLNDTQTSYWNNTLEIGHREDVDSDLDGDFFANSYVNLAGERGNTIRKIGNSTLTTSAVHVRAYELNGGLTVLNHDRAVHTRWNIVSNKTSEVTSETATAEKIYDIPISFGGGVLALGDSVTADPSANIQNSTAAIAFSNDTDRAWATALHASNVGGLTKKGSGTLTLSAVPEYAGVTKVEAGTLVVPEGTKLALDLASAGALSGATITNAAFVAATTSTTVSSDLTNVAVKEWDAAIDVANLTIDLTGKTDWARGATYYVVTEGGVVCGTSVLNRKKVTLLLPSEQQKDWALRVVDLNGKKTLAVKERGGLVMVIR